MVAVKQTSPMKLRNRGDNPFYKSKLRCGILITFLVAIVWTTTTRSANSDADVRTSTAPFEKTIESNNQLLATAKCQSTQQQREEEEEEEEQQQQHGSHRERWSDRFPGRSTSTIQSMFNCDLPHATCRYYFPANFFDEGCGIGGAFAYHITDAESMRVNETLWNNMPSVGFPTITMDNACIATNGTTNAARSRSRMGPRVDVESSPALIDIGEHSYPSKELRCLTERISFIHVHKSGGTSLHRCFDHMNMLSPKATITRHKWFTPKRRSEAQARTGIKATGGMAKKLGGKMYDFTLTSALHTTTYPTTEFRENDHVMFAVVRDPTERFISSIGQAMGGEGSQNNLIGKTLQKECIKSTSALTLTCMAQYVRDHGFWIELHFAPQVIDISFTTIWQDIPIAVFPFRELKSILKYLGLPDVQGRHGDQGKYRPDAVLSKMSVDDYDDESLRIVCEIYEVDVIMQRSLGIEVPRCDPFIPRR